MSKMMLVSRKLLLNRSKSENVLYMPMFGIIGSFLMVYHTHHSDKFLKNSFHKNIENSFDRFSVFLILFKKRIDFGKTINMSFLLLFNSYPTVYHMHHSDERFNNYN